MRCKQNVTQADVVETSLGPMLVGASERGLCWIEFGDDPQALGERIQQQFPSATIGLSDEVAGWIESLLRQLDSPAAEASVPLDIDGTPFQQQVWKALRQIPPGVTETYAQLARRIGKPSATRAVAGACAANDLAIVIPCHRVVRTDGTLGGYRWGIERKQTLLDRERSLA